MSTHESAKNQDPTLYCTYFGGPRDGLKTGDLPEEMSGKTLTGAVSKLPLSEPHQFSLFAVYECTSKTQIDGFWVFEYRGMEGPNGEKLVAKDDEFPAAEAEMSADFRRLCVQASRKPEGELALMTDAQLHELIRTEYATYLGTGTVSDANLEMLLSLGL